MLRRFETLPVSWLLSGFRTTELATGVWHGLAAGKSGAWLANARALPQASVQALPSASLDGRGHSRTHSHAQSVAQTEMARALLLWTFDVLVISVVRHCFYATDASSASCVVMYYGHAAWRSVCAAPLRAALEDVYAPEPPASPTNSSPALGVARVRLVPKRSGMRLIANLGHRASGRPPINALLRHVFHILGFERRRDAGRLMASSVLDRNETHRRLVAFNYN